MRITHIHIEHFRSIKLLDFEPGPYCVLVGENNAGKSNILKALNLLLGETWPSDRSFSEEDFFDQDTSKEIVIRLRFDSFIEEARNNYTMQVGGLELRCKAYKRRVKDKPAGTLSVDFVCIDPRGRELKYPPQPLRKETKPEGFWPVLRVSSALREQVASMIYVGVLREYDRHAPGSRWSVLRRLFNEVNTEFLSDRTKLKITQPDGQKIELTRREAFEASVRDAYQYLRTESFREIERLLAANAVEQMGLDKTTDKVELHFEGHDPTNAYKALQLYVDQLGIRSPASEVGAGLQSAIVVAIFRTYEELRKEGAIFALEEPEVFLHPQKARYFATVLRSLAERGNQVFITTHSPIFVQIDQPENLALVRRTQADGTMVRQAAKIDFAPDDRRALRLLTEFDTQRNELFFARRVLLVEGNTEKLLLPLVFQLLGTDINREGVSVIECGGKTKIPLFARAAKAMDIPFVVLADHDIQAIQDGWSETRRARQEERNRDHERWNRELLQEVGDDRIFWLDPALEDVLGLPREESQKIDRALQWGLNLTRDGIPTSLRAPIERLLAI